QLFPKTWKHVFLALGLWPPLPNDKTPDCSQLQPNTCVTSLTSYCPPNGTPRLRSGNRASLMTSPLRVPIFDGHNDVLLRLYRRGGSAACRALREGEGNGQLDLPMARQGGFAGGLFALCPFG